MVNFHPARESATSLVAVDKASSSATIDSSLILMNPDDKSSHAKLVLFKMGNTSSKLR